MTSICKELKTDLSIALLFRGDTDGVVVVGGGESGAPRPIPLLPNQPTDGVISTKKRSEASFAGRNLLLCHYTLRPLFPPQQSHKRLVIGKESSPAHAGRNLSPQKNYMERNI